MTAKTKTKKPTLTLVPQVVETPINLKTARSGQGYPNLANFNPSIPSSEIIHTEVDYLDVYKYGGETYVLFLEVVDRIYDGQFAFVRSSQTGKFEKEFSSDMPYKLKKNVRAQLDNYCRKHDLPRVHINGVEDQPMPVRLIRVKDAKNFVNELDNKFCYFKNSLPQLKKFFQKFA